MIYLIGLGIFASGGFLIYSLAYSMVLIGGLYFFIFCGLLYALDLIMDSQKQQRIDQLIRATLPGTKQRSFTTPAQLKPMGRDSFSSIDWASGQNSRPSEIFHNPGMEQIPSFTNAPKISSLVDHPEKEITIHTVEVGSGKIHLN